MRKVFSIILAVILLSGVTGCKIAPNVTPVSTDPSSHTAPLDTGTTEIGIAAQQPMIAISVPVVNQSETSEDGTVIFNHSFQNISLIVPDPEVADKIIVDFLNRTDMHEETEQIRSSAKDMYAGGTNSYTPLWSQIAYDPMRIDRGILSLYGTYATYTGGAHGSYTFHSVNYDLVTGAVLSLENILTDKSTSDSVCQLVLDSLTAQAQKESLFDGFESIVRERFNNDITQNTDWFFSNSGLCFFFSPYEIGPFSSGDVVAEIPYSKLTGILNDSYFPAERDSTFGTIHADVFNKADLHRFTQFAEVVLESGSDKTLLYTDTAVYDVQIETGTWSADGSTFTPEHTVLAAYSLTPGDAIMIDAPLNSKLPTLRLSYTTGEKTVSYFLGMDIAKKAVILTQN